MPAAAKPLRACVVIDPKLEHRTPKALSKRTSRHSRQRDKAPIGRERSVGGEHEYVRVEVDEIPKGLNEADQPRLATGQRRGVGIGEAEPRSATTRPATPGAGRRPAATAAAR